VTTPKPVLAPDPENAFESFLSRGLDWINDHRAEFLAGLVAAILLGGASAGVWEWRNSRERGAHEALAQIESTLVRELGGDPNTNNGFSPALYGAIILPAPLEPADANRAREAREKALAAFAALSEERSGTFAATVAVLRAAEVELQLERYADADARLAALIDDLGRGAEVRGVALHMRGGVLEELERPQEAAQLYADAGAIEAYPGRIQAWLAAALTYERLGMRERALASYDAIRLISPEFAERGGLLDRIEDLRAVAEIAPQGAATAAAAAP